MQWVLWKYLKKLINVDNVMIVFEDDETIHCEYENSDFEIYISNNQDYQETPVTDTIIEVIAWDKEMGGNALTPYKYAF